MKGKFSEYHPSVILIYFVVVISFSMFVLHPVFLGISLISSITYSIMLNSKNALKFNIIYMLPTMIIAVIINALTNRMGTTIIVWQISLEAILFGIAAAIMIACVLSWFSCYNKIMTSDKFIYIFGKTIPSLSLVISMIFRFVPRFKAQFKKTVNAQKCVGNDITEGTLTIRIKKLLKIISIMTSWALENSIETADSMKNRGYGLKGRSTFNDYKFKKNDLIVLIYTLLTAVYIIISISTDVIYYTYYPVAYFNNTSFKSLITYAIYTVLCCIPIIIDTKEDIKWKYFQSKI